MGEAEAGADLFEVRDLVGERHVPPLFDDVGERVAVDKLHRHVRLVVVLAAGVDRDDVRVAQRGGRACLAEEPVQDFLVVDLLADHLDRHLAIQLRVAAKVDRAHPPGANLPEDLEVADSRRNGRHYALVFQLIRRLARNRFDDNRRRVIRAAPRVGFVDDGSADLVQGLSIG